MDEAFWLQRWHEGRIGFHRPEVNPWLRQYLPLIRPSAGDRVLVPLCGKSLDLAWLADQGLRPVGVEFSPIACAAVFEQRGIDPQRDEHAGCERWRGDGIELYCGDFLAPGLAAIAPLHALYDRAALIALPPDMRAGYVQRCAELLAPGAMGLLLSLEYDPAEMEGPPFSVGRQEIERLYGSAFELQPLVPAEQVTPPPNLAERGLRALHESVWLLRRRAGD